MARGRGTGASALIAKATTEAWAVCGCCAALVRLVPMLGTMLRVLRPVPLDGDLAVAGAINDLAALLRSLDPILHPGAYAFCEIPHSAAVPTRSPGLLDEAIGWFREAEALSVILPAHAARAAGLLVGFEAAWITLSVHSSLSAVGLTAAVSAALSAEGISCNVVAACRHDHIFVPVDRARDAMGVLARLQAASK